MPCLLLAISVAVNITLAIFVGFYVRECKHYRGCWKSAMSAGDKYYDRWRACRHQLDEINEVLGHGPKTEKKTP